MKFDASALRYLSRDDFRVLTSVEMGMKNHDTVPVELITRIAQLRHGGAHRLLSNLLRHKLLHHESKHFDGYRLTNLGYDYLALRAFLARDTCTLVGQQVGVGKESDIFLVANDDDEEMILKLHRLGRTSFRAIKDKRDYHKGRGHPSWLYLSRLAANKEYLFMKALKDHGFPVPTPIDGNRHCIIMSRIKGYPLNQIKKLGNPEKVYIQMMDLIVRLAQHGLIHGDFNEFNVLVTDEQDVIMIDFPQMVSMDHPNAKMYFDRDVNCVRRFFRKRFELTMDYRPKYEELVNDRPVDLDVEIAASGFTKADAKEFDRAMSMLQSETQENGESDEDSDDTIRSDDDSDDVEVDTDIAAEGVATIALGDSKAPPQNDLNGAISNPNNMNDAKSLEIINSENVDSSTTCSTTLQGSNPDTLAEVEQSEVVTEDSENDESANVGDSTHDDDGPGVEMANDFAPKSALANCTVDRRDKRPRRKKVQLNVRERVRREQGKARSRNQGGKTSRNTVKSRERRKVNEGIREM